MPALIFDCDGVLADTERFGHLPAFNQTFREFGLPVVWSEEEYGRLLQIAGGKERLASLLTPAFVAAANLPADADAKRALVARWHARKTELYTAMVANGDLPPRPGVRRIIEAALDAGWELAVASTSAEASVRAILDTAAGPACAARFKAVLAGDIVAKKKPAPDVYQLALTRLESPAASVLVIEDSRTGLLAATACGLRTVVTVNGYTELETLDEAVLVVSSLGGPGHVPIRVLANRGAARPGSWVTLTDLESCLAPASSPVLLVREPVMSSSAPLTELGLPEVERIVRVMCDVAIANEQYFSELDAAAGDADFGVSLAAGFRAVLARWEALDRSSIGGLLMAVGTVITSTVGGCSGPIWGTAFLRAGLVSRGLASVDRGQIVAMAQSAVEGIMARGKASLGDKTLLDAIVPALATFSGAEGGVDAALHAAAREAATQVHVAREWIARRGRQSFTGERSRGTPDPGMVAVSTMLAAVAAALAADERT